MNRFNLPSKLQQAAADAEETYKGHAAWIEKRTSKWKYKTVARRRSRTRYEDRMRALSEAIAAMRAASKLR